MEGFLSGTWIQINFWGHYFITQQVPARGALLQLYRHFRGGPAVLNISDWSSTHRIFSQFWIAEGKPLCLLGWLSQFALHYLCFIEWRSSILILFHISIYICFKEDGFTLHILGHRYSWNYEIKGAASHVTIADYETPLGHFEMEWSWPVARTLKQQSLNKCSST